MKKKLKIAIDGPAASGKSTTARMVAEALGYLYIDSGAMYRAVTLAVQRSGVDVNDPESVKDIASRVRIRLISSDEGNRTFLDDEDVSAKIRDPQIDKKISKISSYANVREIMVQKQREIAAQGGVVMDGRDIGTVVLPDADLKFYMDADEEVRARRRHQELEIRGVKSDLKHTRREIHQRDFIDSTRDVSPLRAAADAHHINTSRLSVDEQVREVLAVIRRFERQQP